MVPGDRIELSTRGFSISQLPEGWTISSPSIHRGAGRYCRSIVGAHLLVSTPSFILTPMKAWLGIILRHCAEDFPEFTQLITTTYTIGDRKSVLCSTTELPRHCGKRMY